MDVKLVLIVLVPLVALLALFVGYMVHKSTTSRTLGAAESRAKRILDDARRAVEQTRAEAEGKLREAEARARTVELEAKEMALKARSELDGFPRAAACNAAGLSPVFVCSGLGATLSGAPTVTRNGRPKKVATRSATSCVCCAR